MPSPPSSYSGNTGGGSDGSTAGNWSLHAALGWVFDTYTGWQYSESFATWFYVDGQWGWTETDGWHYLGVQDFIWRAQDALWIKSP